MKIEDAVKYVGNNFVYVKDRDVFGDTWQVLHKNDENFQGDCDDFVITCFWYYSDKKLFKFLWNLLITHRYKLYRCKTTTDEYHVIASVDGLWFDNWTMAALPKEDFFKKTKHKITMRYISPIYVFYLLTGLFKS